MHSVVLDCMCTTILLSGRGDTNQSTMGAMPSIEALFWAPLGMDVMLLVGTYSACKLSGLGWYLDEMKKHSEKKNDDDDEVIDNLVKDESHPIHSVWDLAMTAYSAYGCVSRHVSFIMCGISVHYLLHIHFFLGFPSTAFALGNLRCLQGSVSSCISILGNDDTDGCKVSISWCMEVDKRKWTKRQNPYNYFLLPSHVWRICNLQKLLFILKIHSTPH